ncbi:acyl carrier protein [Nocardiopsis salina]|uniref:acyl carrier protein n=1 Tax=Nocardiopsis salina TaxID=245836 RepID=UPI0003480272|nr:acyl carrier protein [Nocardiopsis salina]
MDHTDTIKRFIIEEFLPDLSVDELPDDHDLLSGSVIDSIGTLKLIAWVESRFGVQVDDTELNPDNFRSVASICAFINEIGGREQTGTRGA